MSPERELRCYDYVNAPYPAVCQRLGDDPRGLFARATSAAARRAEAVTTQLELRLGPLAIATEVTVTVTSVEATTSPLLTPATRFTVEWRALRGPGLFPVMHAALTVYALSSHETQVVFVGHYDPPLGWLGVALDALLGHHIAEACALRFVQEVAAELRHELAAPGIRCA
jgi:hypothetical protein